jgi:large subunit ribosomal protein L22
MSPQPRKRKDEAVPESGEQGAAKKPARRRQAAETAAAPKRARGQSGTAAERVEVSARARYVRSAPRKARLVIDHIRGRSVDDARSLLAQTPRGAAQDVLGLLNSAVANAENNHELDPARLVVAKAFVDEGPTLRRYRPRARGRADRILKRTSHMTIVLATREQEPSPSKAAAAAEED